MLDQRCANGIQMFFAMSYILSRLPTSRNKKDVIFFTVLTVSPKKERNGLKLI